MLALLLCAGRLAGPSTVHGLSLCCRYNVVGHVKTVIILAGGCVFFQDDMPLKKLAGISVAMVGIIWYTQASSDPVSFADLQCLPSKNMGKKSP